jgi:hypothetical protein
MESLDDLTVAVVVVVVIVVMQWEYPDAAAVVAQWEYPLLAYLLLAHPPLAKLVLILQQLTMS